MRANQLLTLACLVAANALHAEADSPLEDQMKIFARGTRQLSQQVSDPAKQQSTIELIESLKKAALDSRALTPRKIVMIPEAKRAEFLAAYQAEMDELMESFGKIEEAVKGGDYEKATSLLATVNSIKKEGHGKFKTD